MDLVHPSLNLAPSGDDAGYDNFHGEPRIRSKQQQGSSTPEGLRHSVIVRGDGRAGNSCTYEAGTLAVLMTVEQDGWRNCSS